MNQVLWTYSISLRLLADHPSRPAHLVKCRLLSRHWIIRQFIDDDPNSTRFTEEVVDGEGVIGLFPTLSISDDPERYVSYKKLSDYYIAATTISYFLINFNDE